jgi:uncharacterized protein with HEPN domain
MDKPNKDFRIIERILAYCAEIEQTVAHFGDTFEIFETDKIFRNAATMCILQIGELAGRLSPEFTAAHPAIPWRSIKAMRNIAAHAYGSISIPDVWETITVDIPVLKAYCINILNA